MTNYWWSLLTSHICSKFEPDSHHSHLTNWGSMNNRGGVTLHHPTHEKNFYWKLIWENDILMGEKSHEIKIDFFPFIIHFRLVDSNSNLWSPNIWTLLKLDGVQASSSHINRASLSDQNDGICTVIYLLPRLLQLEWEKKSQQNKRSHPKETYAKFLKLGSTKGGFFSVVRMYFSHLLPYWKLFLKARPYFE